MLNPFNSALEPPAHLLLLVWLVLASLVVFGTVVSIDQGLLQEMLRSDRSQICVVVIAMYLIGAGHTFIRTRYLSRELAHTGELINQLSRLDARLVCAPDHLLVGERRYSNQWFTAGYLAEYFGARRAPAGAEGDDLLDAYASRIRSANEFGWFYIDLMLKVGFLGTLVGFILMLSSVADTSSLDATTMQKVLKQMSLGMSTALYTTLASLVGGILLSVPYYLLDRGFERLVQLTIYAKDVLLPARLAHSA